MRYSEKFKARMIQRMTGPQAISALKLSAEVGISQPTLSRWLKNSSVTQKLRRPMSSKDFPAAEKFRIVSEASKLSKDELGEFLRREGLHKAQLEEWKKMVNESLESPKKRKKRSRLSPEEKRIRELEKELERKDKALAEVTALLVLKKKFDALMEARDEDTPERNES